MNNLLNIETFDITETKSNLDVAMDGLMVSGVNVELLHSQIDTEVTTDGMSAILKRINVQHISFTTHLNNAISIAKRRYRTEFADWARKNKRKISKVEAMGYDIARGNMIDVPSGMGGQYGDVANGITAYFKIARVDRSIQSISDTLDTVMSSISNGDADCERVLQGAEVELSNVVRRVTPLLDTISANFNTQSEKLIKVEFGEQFASMRALQQYRSVLAELNNTLVQVPAISTTVSTIEKTTDTVVDYITREDEFLADEYAPSAKFLAAFASYIGNCENLISGFGLSVIRAMALVHNTTFVYDKLAAK